MEAGIPPLIETFIPKIQECNYFMINLGFLQQTLKHLKTLYCAPYTIFT